MKPRQHIVICGARGGPRLKSRCGPRRYRASAHTSPDPAAIWTQAFLLGSVQDILGNISRPPQWGIRSRQQKQRLRAPKRRSRPPSRGGYRKVAVLAVLVVLVRRHRHAVRAAVRRAVDDEVPGTIKEETGPAAVRRVSVCPQAFWMRFLYMPLVRLASSL